MRQKRYRGLLLLMLGTFVFGGCQEAPYKLTEAEEALIVSYSSHVVSKYNIYQKDGLAYVADHEDVVEIPAESMTEAATEQEAVSSEVIPGNISENTENEEDAIKTVLSAIYEETGLIISYNGCQITDSYMDSSTYAARPSYGKNFLVLNLNVENQTSENISFQNFGSGTGYSAKFLMDSGNWYHAPSVISLVSNEFSTYEGEIVAQSSVEMVLLFEVPTEVTEINSLILKIDRNEEVFEINL